MKYKKNKNNLLYLIIILLFIIYIIYKWYNTIVEKFNDNKNIKVAFLYFGMPRSLNMVYQTHFENIFNIFKNNNINYDIFIHTWKTDKNRVWNKDISAPINYEDYNLLTPNYYKIDNQDEFLESIDFSDYFYKDIYDSKGDSKDGEWIPELIRNHLCALESQRRVTEMMYESNNNYDYVIYIRPDYTINNPFDVKIFNIIGDKTIVIPKDDSNEGYNDRFAIMSYDMAKFYGYRIKELKDFRKNNGRIVSEKYVKYIIDKYFDNIEQKDISLTIVRPK